VWFNIALNGLILIVLCQSYNIPAKNIAHVYVFEIAAKIVLTYHGHKFAREGHNCDEDRVRKESFLLIDCSAEFRVDSLREKIIIPEKTHWHNVYTLRTLKRSEPTAI